MDNRTSTCTNFAALRNDQRFDIQACDNWHGLRVEQAWYTPTVDRHHVLRDFDGEHIPYCVCDDRDMGTDDDNNASEHKCMEDMDRYSLVAFYRNDQLLCFTPKLGLFVDMRDFANDADADDVAEIISIVNAIASGRHPNMSVLYKKLAEELLIQ